MLRAVRVRRTLVAGATLLVLLPACSDSPRDVVEELGEAARERHLVAFKELFCPDSTERLRRLWQEDGLTEAEGWMDLMTGYLGDDARPPDVVGEEVQAEDRAVVKVSKKTRDGKVVQQDLFLKKVGGHWKLTVGEVRYQVSDAAQAGEQARKRPAATLEEPAEEDEFGLEAGKGNTERKLDDFDLKDY